MVNADGQTDGFLRDGDKEAKRSDDLYANKLIAVNFEKFAEAD
ncbi:unnamed protein product [Gongylonema pulchrum]|uniref:Uncharacterized protein n=1 Tax=Gongylonema pulchrum TaxID=637853 RepID=A0A3P7NVW5_9BILA|nr:unnamed protein product [Gongylonema pulchrum]VDN45360.1 unnamed protein product [Gongylonema pulchrum]